MSLGIYSGIAVALVSLIGSASTARAEESEPTSESTEAQEASEKSESGGEHRVINKHRFIAPEVAFSAITNTTFSFTQGFGAFSFEGFDPTTGEASTAKLFAYGQRFYTQLAFSNRFSLDLTTSGTAAVGGDLETIINLGALASLTAGVMPKVRLFTLDDIGLQMSAGVGVYYNRSLMVSPSALIGRATGELEGAEAQLVQQQSGIDIRPAIMVAEGLGPFGAQLSVSPSIGKREGESQNSLDTALHLALDFDRLDVAPVALTGEYALTNDFTASEVSHTLSGGLYYSGKRDFNIGAITMVQPKTGQQFLVGELVMQYYF